MDSIFSAHWFPYLCALIGPFIQEDAAVLGAASASVSGIGTPMGMFIAITIGLTVSDLWGYWLGRAAISQPWAKKHAESSRILKAKDSIVHNLGKSIIVARFIPGTRILLYIAAGVFQASFVNSKSAMGQKQTLAQRLKTPKIGRSTACSKQFLILQHVR